ncbi:unnamed protein product [Mucor hiemalis]
MSINEGYDFQDKNFVYPIRKETGINLTANELHSNKVFGSFRSAIENQFSVLASKFDRFNNNSGTLQITDIEIYNVQFKTACLLKNLWNAVDKFDIEVQPHHMLWYNDDYEFPSKNSKLKIVYTNEYKQNQENINMNKLQEEILKLDLEDTEYMEIDDDINDESQVEDLEISKKRKHKKSKWASSDSSAAFPALSGKPTPGNTTSSSGSKPKKGGKTYSTVTQTASATTTQPVATKKPITAKAKKWAARLFASPVDPTNTTADKSGYSFVYLPSNKRTTYSELRERIKLIGVNLTRIYSISRPAKHVVAILVHSAYAKELLDLFTKAGIKPILDFSPTSARTIGDPRLLETLKSDQQREDKAKSIYYNGGKSTSIGFLLIKCFIYFYPLLIKIKCLLT